MASLKSLAKDTAIYGMSSIVGRFLNYLLFPLYTHVFAAASGGNGVITNMYSYTALLFVILTFGMETTLFRFINRDDVEDPKKCTPPCWRSWAAWDCSFSPSCSLSSPDFRHKWATPITRTTCG